LGEKGAVLDEAADEHHAWRNGNSTTSRSPSSISQIESRVLLYLAGDTEALRLFRENQEADAYAIHARRTMGYAEPEPLKAWCERTGSNLRQLAQARVLGLGYGCGWRKFIEAARVMAGLELSDADSKRIVSEFRESNLLIVDLWNRLQQACEARDGKTYALPLPITQHDPAAKRFLLFRDISITEDGVTCSIAGGRVRVFGGLIAENWTQATAGMFSPSPGCGADAGFFLS
jgi:hypothetical protein